ncbi:platelet endothelial aggregation receptor 1-like [Mytilus trossulus]|uniref:platelet endothelial aggregation receptor 1-like n=1 Tax=Mytilus trossulus TaxID=6551 RepID=UPI003005CC80
MLFVLIIHATILLTITAQKNLTPEGKASQTGTLRVNSNAINAIQPPISNRFQEGNTIYCTHTFGYDDDNPLPAWWMFEFDFELAYITEIQICYRNGQASRMDGFKLYVTNTSLTPSDSSPNGYLCYEDPEDNDGSLPNLNQTIPCNHLGKYVIYYDDKGSSGLGPIVELCYVAINGCQKSFWGSDCQNNCAEKCIERNCFPGNGSCVWGCNPTNCLNGVCDKDTAVCTDGCIERRTGTYCNQYNMASDGLVWHVPSSGTPANQANDGIVTTCSRTKGPSVTFHVDLQEKSIVTGLFVILGEGTTDGYHTIYASNDSNTWNNGIVLYNETSVPTEINLQAVFRFLTYARPVQNPFTELELCEIGIIGCPPTHYGALCNTTCPQNCNGPCDLDVGDCIYGCTNGWTGDRCDQDCNDGFYGKDCLESCSGTCLNKKCDHVTGECIGGCYDGWQGFNCSQTCPDGQFGKNCSKFCDGCISRLCDHASGLCENKTSCNPGYKSTDHCDMMCPDGEFGVNCEKKCVCLIETCSKGTGKCPPGGCKEGFYGESCSKDCESGNFGRNCGEFCGGCISNICDKLDGFCTNTTGCEPGFLYEDYCNKST